MTLLMFCKWVKESQGIKICESTASAWLHKFGFGYKQFSKGLFFDGHDRQNIVEYRLTYCNLMAELEPCLLTSTRPTP